MSAIARGTGRGTDAVRVPGSGTGQLAGITGTLALTIDRHGHTDELTYALG